MKRVLMAVNDKDTVEYVRNELNPGGMAYTVIVDEVSGRHVSGKYDVAVIDTDYKKWDPMGLIGAVRGRSPYADVILRTSHEEAERIMKEYSFGVQGCMVNDGAVGRENLKALVSMIKFRLK